MFQNIDLKMKVSRGHSPLALTANAAVGVGGRVHVEFQPLLHWYSWLGEFLSDGLTGVGVVDVLIFRSVIRLVSLPRWDVG